MFVVFRSSSVARSYAVRRPPLSSAGWGMGGGGGDAAGEAEL